ncbi:MAG: hypothetical protein A2786_00965 [Candidatus Chisholmbacteria bacterium RIFCSPHIGHO2_01_FULL_52_32]|uniref:Methyltransferase type 11 domain-containing protein n=1 Tax=Candidatus Chisholmbacteria bacterium RIFCSPHIGHO2_01_FULL_52_32 TaxID=1797591 RepID=A0A1G1VU93_9BACT|nr:MAG: hypothetical protein A2786_00965 [Candidatus Chisholmbacteria bacterium RIFCSPHIGHO2_01_FULL_52_32]
MLDLVLYVLEKFFRNLADFLHGIRLLQRKPPEKFSKPLRLDLGIGLSKPPGFVGIDIALLPRVDLIHDLETGLPFPDSSVREIRASHTLEHLPHRTIPTLLRECFRVLEPGGKITIKVPDLEKVMRSFLKLNEEKRWKEAWEWIFGSQSRKGQFHKTGFTKPRLRRLLNESGFADITIANYRTGVRSSLSATATKH